MAARSDALLRYKTIDSCLRDTTRKYSLKDLINECSAVLGRRVSTRTVQLDIQFMRNKKEGYGAPVTVYENKYYRYRNPSYSLTDSVIKKRDIASLQEMAATLGQYVAFKEFCNLKSAVNIIEEEIVSIVEKRESVICCESRENFAGIEYFDTVYDAIINKKVLCIIKLLRSNLIII